MDDNKDDTEAPRGAWGLVQGIIAGDASEGAGENAAPPSSEAASLLAGLAPPPAVLPLTYLAGRVEECGVAGLLMAPSLGAQSDRADSGVWALRLSRKAAGVAADGMRRPLLPTGVFVESARAKVAFFFVFLPPAIFVVLAAGGFLAGVPSSCWVVEEEVGKLQRSFSSAKKCARASARRCSAGDVGGARTARKSTSRGWFSSTILWLLLRVGLAHALTRLRRARSAVRRAAR